MTADLALTPSSLVQPNKDGEVTLINPSTGDQVALSDASLEQLGAFVDALDEWRGRAKEAQGLVNGELSRRMDKLAKWTLYDGEWKFTGRSPAPSTSYRDPEKLREALLKLVDAGEIALAAVEEAVPRVVTVTTSVQAGRLKALAKVSPKVGRVVKRFTETTEAPAVRPVRVTRR